MIKLTPIFIDGGIKDKRSASRAFFMQERNRRPGGLRFFIAQAGKAKKAHGGVHANDEKLNGRKQ